MDLFYILLVLLVATRVFGELAERLGQPSLVGELIAGIALGVLAGAAPVEFPQLSSLLSNGMFATVTDLGMFFLMLFAGVEMRPAKMVEYSAGAFFVAVGGMVLPLGLGMGLGWLVLPDGDLRFAQCLFLGTALAITAVPATVRILLDLGQLETRVGQTIVSAAVFDDVLSLVLLAWLTGTIGATEAPGIIAISVLFAKVAVFFGVTAFVGTYLFPRGGRLLHFLKVQEHDISALLVAAFAFAVFAELMGLHFIVGAFVAGLFFGKRTISAESYDRLKSTMSSMTFGFLAPIFFASIGLSLELDAMVETPAFIVALVLIAFAGKIVGAGIAAHGFGFNRRDATAIGVGMSPRGAVELVIAGIALKAGLFDADGAEGGVLGNMFSAVVIMAVVTTVASPIILKRVFEPRRP